MGAIFVTGDKHGEDNMFDLSDGNFPEGRTLDREDVLVILGDFGLFWNDPPSVEEIYYLNWLSEKPWTIFFLDGNHENFDLLERLPTEKKWGAPVGVAGPNIFHLRRGEIYTIGDKTLFIFGGARSIDMEDRKPGRSWWPREIPSEEEMALAVANLERKEWKVDYVFTHAAPVRAVEYLAANHLGFEGRKYLHDPVSEFLEQIAEKLAFSEWHFGHYHLESRGFMPETGVSGTFFANFRSVRFLCSDKEIPRDTSCDDTKEKKPFFLSGAW